MSEVSGQNFNSFFNAMWNMIITLTSAGYGDLYPKTFFGRIVGVVICFWGVLIISFFVVTVTNMLEFTPNEERAYNLLMRLHKKGIMKERAVDVLQSAFIHRNVQKLHPGNEGKILSKFRKFRAALISFKEVAREVRSWDQSKRDKNEIDIITNLMENLLEDVQNMKEQQLESEKNIEISLKIMQSQPQY